MIRRKDLVSKNEIRKWVMGERKEREREREKERWRGRGEEEEDRGRDRIYLGEDTFECE